MARWWDPTASDHSCRTALIRTRPGLAIPAGQPSDFRALRSHSQRLIDIPGADLQVCQARQKHVCPRR